MALTVRFWNFGKRENATSAPAGVPAAEFTNILLKDNCSVVNPAIKLNLPMSTVVYTYNYCYIVEFNRYYYVTDWVWESGLWVGECEVDVLASFKTAIGNQNVYVLRSAYDSSRNMLYDGNIIDSMYPCTAGAATYSAQAANNPFAGVYASNNGVYIVGLVNQQASGVQYYAFNFAGFRQFCYQLFNYTSGWLDIDITEISEDLQKALVNPFQYVVSVFYLPIPVTWFTSNSIGTATTTVYFGWWSVTVAAGGRIIPPGTLYTTTNSLTIPRHPLAASRGAYMNLAPYTFYTLRYYPFGTMDIDTEAVAGWTTLDLYTDIDICTGNAILTIAVNGKGNPIRTVETNLSAPIPTASINVDYMSLGNKSSIVAGAASAISQIGSGEGSFFQNVVEKGRNFIANIRGGNREAIASGAKQTASKILSSVMAARATAEVTGQQGSFTLYDTQTLTLSGRFLPVANEDYDHNGRPLCQMRTINTLYGYVLCKDADISIAGCTEREKLAIQSYMEGGFYFYG